MEASNMPIISSPADDTPSGSENGTHSGGQGSTQSLDLNDVSPRSPCADRQPPPKDSPLQFARRDSLSHYLGMSFFIAPSKNKTFQEKLSPAASESSAVDQCHDSEGQQQYSSIQFLPREFGIYFPHFYSLNC